MREATVLLLEGRSTSPTPIRAALVREGIDVSSISTGTGALDWLKENHADLLVYDASSMRSIGVRTCRRIRAAHPDLSIIHCRSQSQSSDVNGVADIFLVQPFTARKLMNRVKRLLPADDLKEEIIRAGNLTFYRTKRSVEVSGRGESKLTPKLAAMLTKFLSHPNEVISRRQLMEDIWQTQYVGDTRTLDVHVRWLREFIELEPAKPVILKTVRGVGYIFAVPSPE